MISVTPRAAAEIKAAQNRKGASRYGLRVQVVGGGCEGFLYDLLFADAPDPQDRIFESQGLRIFVNTKVLSALDGTVIDLVPTAQGDGFVFENPKARSRCSCGASFSP